MAFKSPMLEAMRKRQELYASILKTANQDEPIAERDSTPLAPPVKVNVIAQSINPDSGRGMSGEAIEYTDEQLQAIEYACKKMSFCLIGSAGTGKTTTVRAIATAMITRHVLGRLSYGTKHLRQNDPAIAFVAFTNRAVENIRKSLPRELQDNALTIHKLLEPAPVFTDYVNDKGEAKTKMEFVFTRNATNPIDDLQVVVVEESSMVSIELHKDLKAACPKASFIYLGDLNQLQPVYGPAILGFRLLQLPVVELTKVWRQALDSDIIRLAQAVKDGKYPTISWINENLTNGQIDLRPYTKHVGKDAAMVKFTFHIRKVLANEYDPETDVMLCPQNVGFGGDEINKVFAQIYGEKRDALVYEVIGGFNKHYIAIGDKVMFNKRDYIIEDIKFNTSYTGAVPQKPSKFLDRWGRSTELMASKDDGDGDMDLEALASALNISIDDYAIEEKVNQASHIVRLRPLWPLYEGEKAEIKTTGDMNALAFSYCISVHKAQGSEWDKVFVVLHNSHGRMLSRELFYTAITRAKKKLIIFYDNDSTVLSKDGCLCRSVKNVSIPGTTIKAKAEAFKGRFERLPDDLKDHIHSLEEEDGIH